MKKILYSIMALAISAFALQSCEDVPAPYDIPGEGGNTDNPSVVEPKGDGTEANPYNIAAAIAATETLASGETTPNNLYIKGVVTNVKECSAQFGNATFYLGDDISSTKTFYVYRAKGLNNQKIKADDEVQEGDTIIVCGPVTNYNGTIETVQNGAYIYYHSRMGGSTGGGVTGDAQGNGKVRRPLFQLQAAHDIDVHILIRKAQTRLFLQHRKQQHEAVLIDACGHAAGIAEGGGIDEGLYFHQHGTGTLHRAGHRTAGGIFAGKEQTGRIRYFHHTGIPIILAEVFYHVTVLDSFADGVGQYSFQTIACRELYTSFIGGKEDNQTIVTFLLTDSHFLA